MKKIIALVMLLALTFCLCSCGKQEEDPTTDPTGWVWDGPSYAELEAAGKKVELDLSGADGVLAKILESGKLVIATSPDYPPMEGIDEATGDVKGVEMLLAQYIAESLGVELQIETMDFDAVLVAVDTGKVDLGISGFGYKADRAEKYELSIGYQAGSESTHHTVVVLKENLDKYNTMEDFNKAGLKIDAQANSLQEMYVNDQLPNAELSLVTTIDQSILDLMAGKVDAIALDSTTAKNYADQTDGKIVSLYTEKQVEFDLSIYGGTEGNVLAAKKGETSLINAVNAVIAKIIEDGDYDNMYYAACALFGVNPDEE